MDLKKKLDETFDNEFKEYERKIQPLNSKAHEIYVQNMIQ